MEPLCQFGLTTIDGHLEDSGRVHNHLPQPELYVRKQAYYRVKEDLALGTLIEQPEVYLKQGMEILILA